MGTEPELPKDRGDGVAMTTDRLIQVLVTVTLIEMMIAIGLGVSFAELIAVGRNWRLVTKVALANYVCVPLATVGLLLLFQPADPMVSAGFLILAVCPVRILRTRLRQACQGECGRCVGDDGGASRVVGDCRAASLVLLLPLMSASESLQVDATKIVISLLVTQLAPLCLGLGVRHWSPGLANRLLRSANILSAILSLATMAIVLVAYFSLMAEIRLRGYAGMSALLAASWTAGWLLGGPGSDNRKALMLTTSLRNVGVGLVIATGNFRTQRPSRRSLPMEYLR